MIAFGNGLTQCLDTYEVAVYKLLEWACLLTTSACTHQNHNRTAHNKGVVAFLQLPGGKELSAAPHLQCFKAVVRVVLNFLSFSYIFKIILYQMDELAVKLY